MVIGTLAYWHISTLKFNFGNTDAVIVQHDAEVAGGSAFERIGNQFAVFADGARIYGEELSATARELDFEGCRQVVVTCKGNAFSGIQHSDAGRFQGRKSRRQVGGLPA